MSLFVRDFLVVVTAVAMVLLVRAMLRRTLPPAAKKEAQVSLPFIVRMTAIFFAIIAGLALTNGTGRVEYLREATAREINGLTVLALVATQIPDPVGAEALAGIEAYVGRLTRSELPALAGSYFDPATGVELARLWGTFASFSPSDEMQVALRDQAMYQLGVVSEQRQIRIAGEGRKRPLSTWIVILTGAAIVIIGATVATLRYHTLATLFIAALTALITFVIIGIYTTDRPFQYGLAEESEFYETFLLQLQAVEDSLPRGIGPVPIRMP